MKIAVLSAANSIHTVKIVNALFSLGHRVRLYSLPDHKDVDQAINTGVETVTLPQGGQKGYFTNTAFLKKALREWNPDVLNAHYASGYGTLAANTGFHPWLLSVWGSDVYEFPYQNAVCKWLIGRNIKKADTIASTSHVMAKQTRKFIKGEKPIFVTPFGVDTKKFAPQTDKHNEIVVGFIKGVSEKYGIRYLLDAFAQVKDSTSQPVKLYVYGDGDQLDEMKQLSKKLGIDDDTTFFGRVAHSDVPEAFRKIDIFCLPSILESFGVAAVEAMSCGVPVITSDADGFTEVMVDEETGFIVPRKNSTLLAEKMMMLVEDAELRRRMGQAGRARVLELYDWEMNIKQLEQALKDTVK
ncbi:MAG: group 1 glycosyl transferase [Oscillospiraceae bacterium]|nr:group 1 glycosyl transferase [Oscillospiraceae bacterium]